MSDVPFLDGTIERLAIGLLARCGSPRANPGGTVDPSHSPSTDGLSTARVVSDRRVKGPEQTLFRSPLPHRRSVCFYIQIRVFRPGRTRPAAIPQKISR